MLPLTPQMCAAVYDCLREFPPFSRWKLPPADEIEFRCTARNDCTADLWRALIQRRYGVDVPFTPDFACLMMVAVKLSREAGKPKRDNRVDGCGYFECADMCLEKVASK